VKLTLYGSKGSIPFFDRKSLVHGGNTACAKLDIGGHIILIDCGSGIMQYGKEIENQKGPHTIDILLSHLHLDHTIGLTMFKPLLAPGHNVRIFTKPRDERPLKKQIFGAFAPPYWPIDLSVLTKAECVAIGSEPFMLNDGIKVSTISASHPDDTISFRVDADKSVVYLLDYEITKDPDKYDKLVKFAMNADCIIFDSCYLPVDYPSKIDWGHSTYEMGVKLARDTGCKTTIMAHWTQDYDDAVLNDVAEKIKELDIYCVVAYDGMEIDV